MNPGVRLVIQIETAEFSKTITEMDVEQIINAIKNFGPIRSNSSSIGVTGFKETFAERALLLGLISYVLENLLPGPGALLLSQDVSFPTSLRIGDTIVTKAKVIQLEPEENKVKFETVCVNLGDVKVVDGTAWVMPPGRSYEGFETPDTSMN